MEMTVDKKYKTPVLFKVNSSGRGYKIDEWTDRQIIENWSCMK